MLPRQNKNNSLEFQANLFKIKNIYQRINEIFVNFYICNEVQKINSLK